MLWYKRPLFWVAVAIVVAVIVVVVVMMTRKSSAQAGASVAPAAPVASVDTTAPAAPPAAPVASGQGCAPDLVKRCLEEAQQPTDGQMVGHVDPETLACMQCAGELEQGKRTSCAKECPKMCRCFAQHCSDPGQNEEMKILQRICA